MKVTTDSFIMNNTRIANILRKDCRYPFYVNRREKLVGSRCEIDAGSDIFPKTQFVIDIPMDESSTTIRELSYLDMIIADAIYTLYSRGKKYFTPNNILTEITGQSNITLAPDRKKRYVEIIDKLCATTIDIYCPGEHEKEETMIESRYCGPFLSASKMKTEHQENGRNRAITYKFETGKVDFVMPLYEYGTAKKQMISVSPSLLQLPFKIKTDEHIILAHYLLHELEIVRNPNNKVANHIFYPYDEIKDKSFQIFGALGVDPNSLSPKARLEKAQDIYRAMSEILHKWKETYLIFEEDEVFHESPDDSLKNAQSFYIEITKDNFIEM